MTKSKLNMNLNQLILFTFLLLLKSAFVRNIVFEEVDFLRILFTDFITFSIIFLLLELIIKRNKLVMYLITNFLMSTYFLATILYYNYYGTLVTYSAVSQLGLVGEVKDSVFELFSPIYLILYLDIFIISILLIIKKYPFTKIIYIKKKFIYSIISLFLVVSISSIYLPIKNGVINEMKLGQNMGFLNYQAYTAFASYNDDLSIDDITYQNIREIKGLKDIENPKHFGVAKDKNVLVVQLEAFQNFLMHLKIDGKKVTPNLSRFADDSLYFSNFYQQIGKGNTSDAEFMLNTSIYPNSIHAMGQKYGDRKLPSLPRILDPYGYTSLTFHTNDINFWNRKEMYPALGFNKYYAKPFFNDEDKIAFGSSDEVLYEKSIEELIEVTENGDKFYANLIAMSSHHPFKIPKSKGLFELPKKFEGSTLGRYIQAANYVDKAFGKLIKTLEKEKLLDDTLIVVYGDHFGMKLPQITDDKDKALIRETLGDKYNEYLDTFNIPLIIRVPENKINEDIQTVGGQIDMMPTIANLLGVSLKDKVYFGQDILNYKDNTLGMRFYLPTGSFLSSDYFFIPGSSFKDGEILDIKTREKLELQEEHKEHFDRVIKLMNLSDSYAENLPKR